MQSIDGRGRIGRGDGRLHLPFGVVAGLAVAALLLSACGGASDNGPTAGSGEPNDGRGGMLEYAECMRENGIEEFPDPGSSGGIDLNGNSVNTDSEQFKTADEKCKSYLPDGGVAQPPAAAVGDAQLQYAKCMRENGVPNFPDPNSDGGIDINGETLGVDPAGPVFQAADETCKKILEDVAGGPRVERKGP